MVVRANVSPLLIEWAAGRSKLELEQLSERFPRLGLWIAGEAQPTVRQLESFSKATATPFGYFFLESPPDVELPVRDFRFMSGDVADPSPDLLDTIYQCERRQEWYRRYATENQFGEVEVVNSYTTTQTDVRVAAGEMRELLDYGVGARGNSWGEAFRILLTNIEAVGILVMVNGVVGSNTHRPLDPNEFRGFALSDDLAPVIFVNNADTKAAQIFTLAHEFAHILLGQSGVDNVDLRGPYQGAVETWSNRFAAEFLVPLESIQAQYAAEADLTNELDRLARLYRVSTLVTLRRLHEADFLGWNEFQAAYTNELDRVLALMDQENEGASSGNFYSTQPLRVSPSLARAVIRDTLEGGTTYSEAFDLLGTRKTATFLELGARLGVA